MKHNFDQAIQDFEKELESMTNDEFFSLIGLTTEEAVQLACSQLVYSGDDAVQYDIHLNQNNCYKYAKDINSLMCA